MSVIDETEAAELCKDPWGPAGPVDPYHLVDVVGLTRFVLLSGNLDTGEGEVSASPAFRGSAEPFDIGHGSRLGSRSWNSLGSPVSGPFRRAQSRIAAAAKRSRLVRRRREETQASPPGGD